MTSSGSSAAAVSRAVSWSVSAPAERRTPTWRFAFRTSSAAAAAELRARSRPVVRLNTSPAATGRSPPQVFSRPTRRAPKK